MTLVRFFTRPTFWLPAALMLLAVLGGALLLQPLCLDLSARDRSAYGGLPYLRCAFDALSLACGCGLLTFRLESDYTQTGRWVLLVIGVVGALLQLFALAPRIVRLLLPEESTRAAALWALLQRSILAALVIAAGGAWLLREGPEGLPLKQSAYLAVATTFSLGVRPLAPTAGTASALAGLSVLTALTWIVWLLPLLLRVRRQAAVLAALLSYALYLALGAGLLTVLDLPRGWATAAPRVQRDTTTAPPPPPTLLGDYTRHATIVLGGAGSGMPLNTAEEPLSEPAKTLLAGVVLVGGLGLGVTGGVGWLLLLVAVVPARRHGSESSGTAVRDAGAASMAVTDRARLRATAQKLLVALVVLTVVVALGLLGLEQLVASPYESAPTLADALLEASSAVGGAGLGGGLTASLSSTNLCRGINQPTDWYPYGMGWLMLAMLTGRVLPIMLIGDRDPSRPRERSEAGA